MVKLKYYESGATFDASSLNNDDIAFVEDSKTIYTHGVEFKPDVTADDVIVAGTPDANGHAYVDLGLPSGTLWATMNVGASSETDYGNYYQYGKGAAQYAATSGDSKYGGTEDPLDSSVDTASQVWGGSWHMPTRTQMQELIDNTTYQWVTNYKGSGINGGTFTATNGAVLFIPAAGLWSSGSQYNVGSFCGYWGSSPYGSNSAYYLLFGSGFEVVDNDGRGSGHSVRGVLNPVTSNVSSVISDIQTSIPAGETIHVSKNNAYIAPGTWPDRAQYTGTVDENITLHEGLTILYKLPVDFEEESNSAIANTLNINNFGEYRMMVNPKVTYEAGDMLLLVYREHIPTSIAIDGHVLVFSDTGGWFQLPYGYQKGTASDLTDADNGTAMVWSPVTLSNYITSKIPTDNNTTYKLTIGDTTNGDSTNGVSLGSLTRGTATSGGTTLSLVNTGDMYTWNNKQNAIAFNSTYNASTNKAATMTDVNTKATKASITAGTAGTSSATNGATLAVPYVTMSAEGVVTGYGTHTHTITGFVPSGGHIVDYVIGNTNLSSVATSLTADGSETIIYRNTSSSAITVSFATGDNIVFIDGNDCMEIPAGGYGEVNFLRIEDLNNVVHVFVRSAVSE